MHLDRSQLFILLSIVTGLILKLLFIGANELAHDEPFTVLQAHRSITGLFRILPQENNPPLHFLLMHFWVKLVPLEAAWLRVPSAIFSALLVWPLFRSAEVLGGMRTAVIAVLLYFFSNYHLGFAHEVRAYSLFALLATASIWQLIRISRGSSIIWLVMINVLMIYTHFFGWLMIGIQFLCIALLKEWRPLIGKYMRMLAVCTLSYLPYAYIFFIRMGTSVSEGTWLTTPSPEEIYNMIWRWSNAPVGAVFLLLMIVIHSIRTRAREFIVRLGLIWAFVPMIGMFAASFFVPMFLDRYLIYASPGFYMLAAVSLQHVIPIDRFKMIPAAIAIGIMGFTFTPRNKSWPTPSRVVALAEEIRMDGSTVLIHPWWYIHTYAWHLDKQLFHEPDRLIERMHELGIQPLYSLNDLKDGTLGQEKVIVIAGAEEQRRFSGLPLQPIKSVEADRNVHVHWIP